MIEGAVTPRGRVVAILAAGRKTRRDVWGIVRIVEIRLVATDAGRIGAGQVVISVHVALLTLQGGVCAGERKAGRGVIETRVSP